MRGAGGMRVVPRIPPTANATSSTEHELQDPGGTILLVSSAIHHGRCPESLDHTVGAERLRHRHAFRELFTNEVLAPQLLLGELDDRLADV